MIVNGVFTSIGDTMIIELDAVQYATSIDSSLYTASNESPSRFFNRYFRYSTNDKFSYSDWILLTDVNLQAIVINPIQNLYIEIKFERAGTDATLNLIWNTFELFINVDINIPDSLYPVIFTNQNQKFGAIKVNNVEWHELCTNLVKKNFEYILPKFIDRTEGLYFIVRTYCCFLSLYFIYSKIITNWFYDKNQLLDHLTQKGLYFSGNETIADLQKIAQNLFGEYEKRGSILAIDEIKRLLNISIIDEFIFVLVSHNDLGWFLDRTSPLYRGVERIDLLNKMLEQSQIFDLSKYYLINAPNISIISDTDNEGKTISALKLTLSQNCGLNLINFDPLDDRLMKVNSAFDYEISFRIKQLTPIQKLEFGVKIFDINGNYISTQKITDGTNYSDFWDKTQTVNIYPQAKYVKIKGILYNSSEALRPISDYKLNINYGWQLRLPANAVYIYPIILTNNTTVGVCDVRIYDIRLAILNYKPFVSFIENSNYVINNLKNNSTKYNDIQIEDIISKYLVPLNFNFELNTY